MNERCSPPRVSLPNRRLALFYDIASYVHQIARGAKPSDMPIEQSPRFYMAVNLKTAALLGVSLSDVFIARANEVRE